MTDPALEVDALTKFYGNYKAVSGISFTVPRGAVVGLLGANGAGKTTTIQMLLGITEVTSGGIRYFGQDFRKHRQECLSRINFTSAYNSLQGKITVRENLLSFALLYSVRNPKRKIAELMEFFEIDSLSDQIFWSLSAGQRTRVSLTKALLNDPELILMDEPTASLDPDIRDKTLSLVENLRANQELSILFTSHNMEEVTRICDEVIFLDQGRIVLHDSPKNLTLGLHATQLAITFSGSEAALIAHLRELGTEFTMEAGSRVAIATDGPQIPALLAGVANLNGIQVMDVDIRKPTLEGVFLSLARRSDGLVQN